MNRYEPERIIQFFIPRWWIFIVLPICLIFPLKAEASLLEKVPSTIEGSVSSLIPSDMIKQPEDNPDLESSEQQPHLVDITLPVIDTDLLDEQKLSGLEAQDNQTAVLNRSSSENPSSTPDSAAETSLLPGLDLSAASIHINLPKVKVETPVIKAYVSEAAVEVQPGHLQATLPVVHIKTPDIEIPELAVETPAVSGVKLPQVVVKTPAPEEPIEPAAPSDSLLPEGGRNSDVLTPQPNLGTENNPLQKIPAAGTFQPKNSVTPTPDSRHRGKQTLEQQIPGSSEHEPICPASSKPETAILWPNASLVPNPPSSSGGGTQEIGGSSGKVLVRFSNDMLTLINVVKYNHFRMIQLGSDQWSQPPPGMPPEYTFFS